MINCIEYKNKFFNTAIAMLTRHPVNTLGIMPCQRLSKQIR